MEISVSKKHDITLNKEELDSIKTVDDYMVFLENMGFLFIKLCNYSDKFELTPERKRYKINMERNIASYLLQRNERYGK